MAQYYFDYITEVLSDGLGVFEKAKPIIEIERDYNSNKVDYVAYITIPQWNGARKEDVLAECGFDEAELIFDIWGIDLAVFEEDVKESISYANYKKAGSRLEFYKGKRDYSGTGKLLLKNSKTKEESILYFAINFTFKKIINYSVEEGKIIFSAQDVKEKINVRVVYAADRYPCLVKDTKNALGFSHEISFKTSSYTLDLKKYVKQLENQKFFVCFDESDKDAEKHYLLKCVRNDGLDIEPRNHVRPTEELFCPYCHGEIKQTGDMDGKYNSGCVGCNGKRLKRSAKEDLVFYEGKVRGKTKKQILYCNEDLENKENIGRVDERVFNGLFARILPEAFFDHHHFKIAVGGSRRAGKTTMISKLFNIKGKEENISLSATTTLNALRNKFPISMYSIKSVKASEENETVGKAWCISKDSWYEKQGSAYARYAIDVAEGVFPGPTDKSGDNVDETLQTEKFPFIFEVTRTNGKADYVYLYDIAGEDAEHSAQKLETLTRGTGGIFYLIDGKTNTEGNNRVFTQLQEVLRSKKNCPIAVILTKFDTLEKYFDPNCQCLRSDVYDMMEKKFEESELENNIAFSSEEIKAFLLEKKLLTDFSGIENVCFFAVSAFSSSNAVVHKESDEKSTEHNSLEYECSPKRLELPLIWMLKQFGSIV